jgi:hypothetical protein
MEIEWTHDWYKHTAIICGLVRVDVYSASGRWFWTLQFITTDRQGRQATHHVAESSSNGLGEFIGAQLEALAVADRNLAPLVAAAAAPVPESYFVHMP